MEFCKEISVAAGKAIMEIYTTDFQNTIETKEDNSPLTIADIKANQIITSTAHKLFPHISMLSEESVDDFICDNNDLVFVVDPLDGTKEFINRNGQFTVNVALVYKKKPVASAVYVPVSGTLYYASQGQGAYKTQGNTTEKIHVTNKLSDLVWVGSKSHSSEKEQNLIAANKDKITQTISAGSSLKGVMVAEGAADVYYRFGYTSEWDTCAMHCIVEQAGGIFRQLDNTEMLYGREDHLNRKGFYIVNRKENIWV